MTQTLAYVPLLAEDLRALRACPEQVRAVARLWPHGVVPTPENLARAQRAKLSLGWLAETLDPTGYRPRRGALDAEFAPRRDALAYDVLRACWPVWDEEEGTP